MKNKKEKSVERQDDCSEKRRADNRHTLSHYRHQETGLSGEDGLQVRDKKFRHALKKKIVGMLHKRGSLRVEDFVRKLDIPPHYLLKVLGKLERKGVVVRAGEGHKHHQREKFAREGFVPGEKDQKKSGERRARCESTLHHHNHKGHKERKEHTGYHKHYCVYRSHHRTGLAEAGGVQFALNI